MTIDIAIQVKEEHLHNNAPYDIEELEVADRVSIEALKWYKAHRPIYPPASLRLLPGETKD